MSDAPFVLHEELLKLAGEPQSYFIPNEVSIEGLNDKEIERRIDGELKIRPNGSFYCEFKLSY